MAAGAVTGARTAIGLWRASFGASRGGHAVFSRVLHGIRPTTAGTRRRISGAVAVGRAEGRAAKVEADGAVDGFRRVFATRAGRAAQVRLVGATALATITSSGTLRASEGVPTTAGLCAGGLLPSPWA